MAQALQNPEPENRASPHGSFRQEPARERVRGTGQEEAGTSEPPIRRKATILIDAARHFSRIERPEPKEIETFKEFFYALIAYLGPADRRLISAMLARQAYTPRQIALFLAQDKIEIAAPFLLFSPVLGEIDLKAIARKKGEAYAEIILKRTDPPNLSAPDTPSLRPAATQNAPEPGVQSDRQPVHSRTEPKPDARLSTDELMALASTGGKLGRRMQNDQRTNPSETEGSGREAHAGTELDGRDGPRPGFLTMPANRARALLMLARRHDIDGFATEIEAEFGLAQSVTRKLVAADGGDEIVYLVRAMNLPSPLDRKLILLLAPRYGRSMTAYKAMKGLCAELDTGICRIIFNEIGGRFEMPVGNAEDAGDIVAIPQTPFRDAVQARRAAFAGPPSRGPASNGIPGAGNIDGRRQAS